MQQKRLRNAGRRAILMDMTNTQETVLIEALKKVDALGDVAPAHVQDPMTMVLRQRAIQDDLMRWDDSRGRYVLTGTGRSRITADCADRDRRPALPPPRRERDAAAAQGRRRVLNRGPLS